MDSGNWGDDLVSMVLQCACVRGWVWILQQEEVDRQMDHEGLLTSGHNWNSQLRGRDLVSKNEENAEEWQRKTPHIDLWTLHVHMHIQAGLRVCVCVCVCVRARACARATHTALMLQKQDLQSGWVHNAVDYNVPICQLIFFFLLSTPVFLVGSLEVEPVACAFFSRVPLCTLEPTVVPCFSCSFTNIPDFLICTTFLGTVPRHWSHVSSRAYIFLMAEMLVCWLSALHFEYMTVGRKQVRELELESLGQVDLILHS